MSEEIRCPRCNYQTMIEDKAPPGQKLFRCPNCGHTVRLNVHETIIQPEPAAEPVEEAPAPAAAPEPEPIEEQPAAEEPEAEIEAEVAELVQVDPLVDLEQQLVDLRNQVQVLITRIRSIRSG